MTRLPSRTSASRTTSPRPRITVFSRGDDQDTLAVTDILRMETVGGALLLVAAVAAMLWANLAPESYDHLRHVHLGPLTLQHWASDGLLTLFFFVAGLELKRELVAGSLRRPAQALVPIVAALAGMAVPALLYLGVNLLSDEGQPRGWAIPMATDIAFALAVLAVVGRHLPASLRAFLLTLAIVDDLGAILVIATVFSHDLNLAWLAGGVALAAVWWLFQRRRVEPGWWYVPLFLGTWWCVLSSGVHATVAGVALGLLTRTTPDDEHDPIDRWEHFWNPVSAGFAVPAFALMSAGVLVDGGVLADLVREPVAIGIVLGLVAGKALGVFGGAWLTARFTRAELADDLRWSEVFSVSCVAGVGFTVALLMSDLAFASDPALADEAKVAVLAASLLAGTLAAISLGRRSRRRAQEVREGDTTALH